MEQTLYSAYFHIVFSTKNRYDFTLPEIEEELTQRRSLLPERLYETLGPSLRSAQSAR